MFIAIIMDILPCPISMLIGKNKANTFFKSVGYISHIHLKKKSIENVDGKGDKTCI